MSTAQEFQALARALDAGGYASRPNLGEWSCAHRVLLARALRICEEYDKIEPMKTDIEADFAEGWNACLNELRAAAA